MAQPKMQQEPTMEEILASIRRIIDSGEDGARDAGVRHEAGAGSTEQDAGDFRYEEADREAEAADDSAAWPDARRDPVVVSRTHGARFEPVAAPQPEEDAASQGPADEQAVYPGSMHEVAQQVRAATAEPVESETPAMETGVETAAMEGLLSQNSEQRIGEALQELSRALQQEGARSIEEIVAEELKPLLREWLDEHMPGIVENMVAKEIERLRPAKR